MPSPYAVLGVKRNADKDEIEDAYRERVKETHPDLGGDKEEFKRVQAAYEAVTGDENAEAYDSLLNDRQNTTVESTVTTVKYLNYERVQEYGWSLEDTDLFEKAKNIELDSKDFGAFTVMPDESVLEAAEREGQTWPFSCRGGACANCAVKIVEGDISTEAYHILPNELLAQGFRLSCIGNPLTPDVKLVYNVKHLPELDDLRLPSRS